MLEYVLQYISRGWRCFPLHSIVDGKCTCGRKCASPGKHPRVKGGFKSATLDATQVTAWWSKWPQANIGIATGAGLTVVDLDGPEGVAELAAMAAEHDLLPLTLTAQTGRGYHLYFNAEGIGSSAKGKVHIRGEGGYVIAPPSNHISGNSYKWLQQYLIADMPDWLRDYAQATDKQGTNGALSLGPLPNYLKGGNALAKRAQAGLRLQWSQAEEDRLWNALSLVPSNTYDDWLKAGLALHSLEWQRSDGTDIGLDLWHDWSEGCAEKYAAGVLDEKWQTFGRANGTRLSEAWIFHRAKELGWRGDAFTPQAATNGQAGPITLPIALTSPIFPDVDRNGAPRATCTNTAVAIQKLGISCTNDVFHEKMLVGGQPIEQWAGDLSDAVVQMLRRVIYRAFGFDPGERHARDGAMQLCLENPFNPVTDYLDGLKWDGVRRLDTWTIDYLSAADTALNRAIGRLTLIAAVRRAYDPGTKFDQIIVLEGAEGTMKSTAIRILAGDENFSDQHVLGASDKEQQEAIRGVWLHEIADLVGMKRTEIERIKAFASRTEDRARPAYGRFRLDLKRRCIFFATTNMAAYLKSDTGNRRFWPIATGTIKIAELQRDRDQLWAEAAEVEAGGASIVLDPKLWREAGEAQEERMEVDTWEDLIAEFVNGKNRITDCTIADTLRCPQIAMRPADINLIAQTRAARVLKRLGFERYQRRDGHYRQWRYRR